MKLEQSFDVPAPVEAVWATLLDIEKIAPCLPGADITGHDDEGNYTGTFNIKLGPTNASYRGTLKIGETDEATHRATLHARGQDKRGQGGATATIVNTLEAIEGGTRVHADTDFTITGRLASFSRSGMIKDISNRLLREFSSCLSETITYDEEASAAAAAPAAAPEEAASVGEAEAVAESVANSPAGATPAPAADPTAAPTPAIPPATAAGAAAPKPKPRPQAKELNAGSLFFSVLLERIRRLFGRGRK